MTTYYAVRDPDTRALAGVMAETAQLRGPGDERLYFWVPSLGAWVLDDDILRDFRSFEGDRENAYEEIDPLQAAALIREAPALDRWTVAQFKTQPERLTSAELGLPVDVGQPRPTADPHTLESIEKAAPGAWVTVRTFPDDARGRTAARTWASNARWITLITLGFQLVTISSVVPTPRGLAERTAFFGCEITRPGVRKSANA